MAEVKVASSKTTASVYENKKGVSRVQVAFDASKLSDNGAPLDKALVTEISAAIVKAVQQKAQNESA
jgi:hypothetical protein